MINNCNYLSLRRKAMAAINFPVPPQKSNYSSMQFPSDLNSGGKQRYCSLGFSQYDIAAQSNSFGLLKGGGAVKLPMPYNITETVSQQWEAQSLLPNAVEAAKNSAAGGGLSSALGASLNPFLFFKYKNPNYKQFQLDWEFFPVNQKESDAIKQICNYIKKHSMPTQGQGGSAALFGYPDIIQISFQPDDYLFQFKPAVVESVTVNYSPAGQPSFFKAGAPTTVSLSISISEIQWWTQQNAGF